LAPLLVKCGIDLRQLLHCDRVCRAAGRKLYQPTVVGLLVDLEVLPQLVHGGGVRSAPVIESSVFVLIVSLR
jgi:hypothetical protein